MPLLVWYEAEVAVWLAPEWCRASCSFSFWVRWSPPSPLPLLGVCGQAGSSPKPQARPSPVGSAKVTGLSAPYA
ncbi:hypothetical protein [Streptomyces sp. NPDC021224]|uniref:hypothetical protein n=1 Tax=unclassified Streptomyces TaxID=2593676 RepID=UPI0037885C39